MKTKIKGLLAILIGLFMFSSLASKAAPPCPKIENRTQCVVKLTVSFFKKDADGNCTTFICSTIGITVGPFSSVPVTPPAGCDCACVSITVVGLNGMPVAPTTVDNFGSGGPVPLPANPCGAGKLQYDGSIPAFQIVP